MKRHLLLRNHKWMLFMWLGMSACTHMTPQPDPVLGSETPATGEISPSVPPTSAEADNTKLIVPAPQTSAAVLQLLDQARAATLRGDLPRAEVALERAVRIEPKNSTLWNYLAKVRLQQGRFNEAAGLAQKSNSLARQDKKLQADNWRIIAHARFQSGDLAGAREAQAKVEALGQ